MLRFIYFVTVVAAILSFADAIWNGETPEPLQYPYTAGLSMVDGYFNLVNSDVCGGALISNNLVITTANCVNFYRVYNGQKASKSFITLYLGGHNFFSKNKTYEYDTVVNENDVILHPKYNKTENMKFDIALIRLQRSVKESDKIKIVSLPPENLDLPVGQDIIITGWGKLGDYQRRAKVLQDLNTTVVPKEDCSKSDESVTEDNICVYTHNKSICFGDSGSPNYIRTKGELILVGLSQRLLATDTKASCERDLPHLSISIIPYLSWINSEINKYKTTE